ncbi:MAG: ATP-binding protein [Phycisphaerales bacterium]
MNLKRRLLLTSSVTVLITTSLTVLAYVLLSDMAFHIHSVTEEYQELRQVEEIDDALMLARLELLKHEPSPDAIITHARTARQRIREYLNEQDEQKGQPPEHLAFEEDRAHRVATRLALMIDRIVSTTGEPNSVMITETLDDIAVIHDDLLHISSAADDLVDAALDKTNEAITLANTLMLGLCGMGVTLAFAFALLHYRWFITPVQQLRDRVRKAVADRQDPLENGGNDLIGELNAGFAGLVDELNGLYNSLEHRVNAQSRELVQSERLASVGYLAAGVAHEINNPLNAILGYCELMLRSRRNGAQTVATDDIESLEVIRNETLRCRQIVDKLLSLVRKSDAPQEPVDLAVVAREVVAMLDTLKQFRRCSFEVQAPREGGLVVSARESEMKQVLLNLVINAAEAASDTNGRVIVRGEQREGMVLLSVEDNGRGMTPEILSRVFEPFYTQKRGGGRAGTGLGLSIVHAIIHDHRGNIVAASEGPGRGSRFTISLPQATTTVNT